MSDRSEQSIESSKTEIQKVMSHISDFTLSKDEKLDYEQSFVTWGQQIDVLVKLVNDDLFRYFSNEEVEVQLLVVCRRAIHAIITANVKGNLAIDLAASGVVGIDAVNWIKCRFITITPSSVLSILKRMAETSLKSSGLSSREYMSELRAKAEELKVLDLGSEGLISSFMLFCIDEPAVCNLLTTMGRQTIDIADLTAGFTQWCKQANVADSSGKSIGTAMVAANGTKCWRCGIVGHYYNQCVSTTLLESWKKYGVRVSSFHQKKEKTVANIALENEKVGEVWSISTSVSQKLNASPAGDHWVVDSGATVHITNNKNHFKSFSSCSGTVDGLSGSGNVRGRGKVDIFVQDPSSGKNLLLKLDNVLYIPECGRCLLSTGRIAD